MEIYGIPVAVVSKFKVFCYFGSFLLADLQVFLFANPDSPCHPGELADQPIKARVAGHVFLPVPFLEPKSDRLS